MKVVAVLGGLVLGVVAAVIGAFVAGIVGLALAGAGSSRGTGADVLFLVPFVGFAVVSLLAVAVPPVRRTGDGLFAVAGATSFVLLLVTGAVLVQSGIQRL